MHHHIENAISKLYMIHTLAREEGDENIATLAYLARRELEAVRYEVFDLDTWLANHQGLLNYPYDDDDYDDSDDDNSPQ